MRILDIVKKATVFEAPPRFLSDLRYYQLHLTLSRRIRMRCGKPGSGPYNPPLKRRMRLRKSIQLKVPEGCTRFVPKGRVKVTRRRRVRLRHCLLGETLGCGTISASGAMPFRNLKRSLFVERTSVVFAAMMVL